MRVIIVGCGRVGARVAAELHQRGEHVTVIDTSPGACNRLPPSFKGETVRGNGTDEDVVRSAGAEQADIFMALTEGDNRNALSAQLGMSVDMEGGYSRDGPGVGESVARVIDAGGVGCNLEDGRSSVETLCAKIALTGRK